MVEKADFFHCRRGRTDLVCADGNLFQWFIFVPNNFCLCIFPPVKLLYNLLFPAIWQENITITIKSNLRLLPINERCPSLKWDWNNLWGFFSHIRMQIIPQGGIDFCRTASIIYFLISSHSWNNVIIGRQHRKFSASWRILQINAGTERIFVDP